MLDNTGSFGSLGPPPIISPIPAPLEGITDGIGRGTIMGRDYPVEVIPSLDDGVDLIDNMIKIKARFPEDEAYVRSILNRFYASIALREFPNILEDSLSSFRKFRLQRPELFIKPMNLRAGGALRSANRMYLNIDLIKTSRRTIEYVIFHELCHFIHNEHGPEFYNCLTDLMPDWRARKRLMVRKLTRIPY